MAAAGQRYESRIGIGSALRQYRRAFVLRGRATRSELISFWLFALFVGLASGWGLELTGASVGYNRDTIGAVNLLSVVVLFLPWPALLFRRAHDQNLSGWWAVVLFMIVIALAVFSSERPITETDGLEAAVGVLWSLAHFVLSLAPGTHGPNRFGLDPRLNAELAS